MAYIIRPEDDERKDEPGAPAASSPFAPLAPATAAAPTAQKPQGSGQFLDYNRLLQANKDDGARVAASAAARTSRAVGEANSALTGAVNDFATRVGTASSAS